MRAREAPASLSRWLVACCERFEAESGRPCHRQLDVGVWDRQFSINQQEQLERIVAEALTNVHKHARATAAWVEAKVDGERLLVEIRDDGSGFDPTQVPRHGHYGLRGLSERARLLGGSLTIDSAPGGGTTIVVDIPVETEGERE